MNRAKYRQSRADLSTSHQATMALSSRIRQIRVLASGHEFLEVHPAAALRSMVGLDRDLSGEHELQSQKVTSCFRRSPCN
jgi:hypothetical protein